MVWVGRDLKDHLVPTPLPWAGTPSTRPGAQSPIQPGLEHCQGGGSHSFSGQPVPVPQHPHREEFFLCIWSKCFSVKPFPLVLSLHALVKSPSPALLQACFQVLEGCCKVSPQPSLLHAEQPNSLSLSS